MGSFQRINKGYFPKANDHGIPYVPQVFRRICGTVDFFPCSIRKITEVGARPPLFFQGFATSNTIQVRFTSAACIV